MSPVQRLRSFSGPAVLSYGFRPFFFLAACQAAIAVALWLPLLEGEISLPTLFAPRDWHAHEMLFGYVPAVLTGFLLTAIPNWTGRLPLQGGPLLVLVAVWIAGRFAVAWSAYFGWSSAALIDCSFLVLVVAAAAREVLAGRNWRNIKVIVPVTFLALANVGFHVEAHMRGLADYAPRAAIAAILTLIMLIGGRIIPSFTRSWLVRENPGRFPLPFARFDVTAISISVFALCLWVFAPAATATGVASCTAGVLQFIRLGRWAGERTARERLVLALHVAYFFVPLGFLLTGLAIFGFGSPSAGLHAWMVGAAGAMTLAVMTRASLGHTGQELTAGVGTQIIYIAIIFAALTRIAAALVPGWSSLLLHCAALGWVAAFASFAVIYGPILFRERRRAE
jgi:uncharacterized protein involved in response to NO